MLGHKKGRNTRRSVFEPQTTVLESQNNPRRIFTIKNDVDTAKPGVRTAVQGFHNENLNSFRSHKMKKSEAEKNKNVKNLMRTFFQKSSIYALSQIGNSQTTQRKVFWSFILIGGLIGCSSQVYRYLSTYCKYPVVVNIESATVFNQYFPAVTVCNLNNIQKKYLTCFWRSHHYHDCHKNTVGNVLEKHLTRTDFNSSLLSCLRNRRGKLHNETLHLMRLSLLYFSADNFSRVNYGQQAQEFIQSCSFNGEKCSYANFKLHTDSVFGNCYSFNKVATNREPLRTSFVGPNSGLSLELDVQNKEYTLLSKSVGARVVIHDPYQEPFPQEQGINVSPGFETILGLSKTMMVRLPDPYKDHCKHYRKGESQKQCDMECFQEQIAKKCGCKLYKKKKISDRLCDLTNPTDICCVYNARGDQRESCYCPLECESSNYEVKISSVTWPTRKLSGGMDTLDLKEIRQTRLSLKIYFDTLEQLTYQQKPMFDEEEVLSQIGGQMGLWLGLSLAAMFECVENAILLWNYKRK